MSATLRRSAAALLLLTALAPTPAFAHTISGSAADRTWLGFVPLGIEHMLLGWDHLLFIGGIVLLAGEFRLAARMVSVFAAGHSLTLICAVFAGWEVSADVVDVVIVLSLAFVGAVGLVRLHTRLRWDYIGGIVFLFGLVHGLGLASRLQALGLPREGLLLKVIAFNVGVEIGQVTAIFAAVVLGAFLFGSASTKVREAAITTGAVALLFIGSVLAPLTAYRTMTEPPGSFTGFATYAGSTCDLATTTSVLPSDGDHPRKAFWGPEETAPLSGFGHSLGDGFVVVLYPRDLPATSVRQIRALVESQEPGTVLAGADEGDDVRVISHRETLSCDEFERSSVEGFMRMWFRTLGVEI